MEGETALTGMLPFVFIMGAVIAFPLSLILLSRYRAAVLRTMAASGGAAPVARPLPVERDHGDVARPLEIATVDAGALPAVTDSDVYAQIARAPRATVRAYAVGGVVYAAVLGAAQLLADGSFSLLRFIAMTYIYAWPIAIAANLIVPSTRRTKLRSYGAYFAGLAVISTLAVSVSTDLGFFDLFVAWGLFSLPPTILVLAFLHRRVRAVGVMVLAFTVIALTGANVALALVGSSASLLRATAGAAAAVGSSAVGAIVTIILIGTIIFGVVAWFAIKWIKRLYLDKRLSDQSLLLDSMWLVFAMIQSIGLAFAGVAWYLAGIVAFVAYRYTVIARMRTATESADGSRGAANLLFLRVFSLGRRSEQVFDVVSTHWRYAGNVRMIAGPDLAVTTVEPHEFLEYLSGKIDQSFIPSNEALESKMAGLDASRDFDGRYRVNDFFCYDDTWKAVLSRLVLDSDAVLMDVRGFSADNAGVVFELNELMNVTRVDRVVLVADETTDSPFLEQTLQDAWANMRSDSPNRDGDTSTLRVCTLTPDRPTDAKHVLRSLSAAARRTEPGMAR